MDMAAAETHPMLSAFPRGRLHHALCNRFEGRRGRDFHACIESPFWRFTHRTFIRGFITLNNKATGQAYKMFF